jgi:ABC-type amino acid transport substrate-binding protein
MRTHHLPSLFRFFVALTILLCATCFAAEQPAGSKSTLRVGVAPNMPPMVFKEGGGIAGIEADLANVLGRELGRTRTFWHR